MSHFIFTRLSIYLARIYFTNFCALISILLGIVLLFDTIELLRRASKKVDVPLSSVLEMGLLRLPDMAQTIAPFAVLFAALFTFWQLSKRQELVVMRSSGISVWQFLSPILATVLTIGIVMVTFFNPLSAILYSEYKVLENTYLKSDSRSVVAVFAQGLWLRQDTDSGYAILHAEKIDPSWRLDDVMVLSFKNNNVYEGRIDSPSARLGTGGWVLDEAIVNNTGKNLQKFPSVTIPTHLTPQDIEESFSSPQAMGFWSLPSFIRTLEVTGFDSTRLRIHFQALLAQPLLYFAMVILAACVGLRPQRQGQTFLLVVIGITIGFLVFLMSNFVQALGISHQLPVFLASWSPAMLALLFGGTVLLTLEDG